MKKLIQAVLMATMFAGSSAALASKVVTVPTKMVCTVYSEIAQHLRDKGQAPILEGNSSMADRAGTTSLFYMDNNGNYTLVIRSEVNTLGCIIDFGKMSRYGIES